jgi:hypothetical protein
MLSTISPRVAALAVGLPAQRAIAQRFSAMAHRCGSGMSAPCRLLGAERTRYAQAAVDPGCVYTTKTLSDHAAYARRGASYHQRCCIGW